MFQIEKNIPVPVSGFKGFQKYPFREMAVGDSFLVPAEFAGWRMSKSIGREISVVARAASAAGKRMDRRFTARTQPDRSVRIWRIA